MDNYEQDQSKLQKLWDEIMSDEEEEPFGGGGTSDEYSPESSSESDSEGTDSEPAKKKRRYLVRKKVSFTSKSQCDSSNPSTSASGKSEIVNLFLLVPKN